MLILIIFRLEIKFIFSFAVLVRCHWRWQSHAKLFSELLSPGKCSVRTRFCL